MKRATTSASNIFRRKLCPGSAAMEAPFAEQDSEYSAEGTMLHKLFLTGRRPETLTPEQVTTLDLADFYAEEHFRTVRDAYGISDDEPYFDERDAGLMLYDLEGKELFPGHLDVCRTWPKHRVRSIVDAKMGFMEVPTAADNLQLSAYFAMREQQSSAAATGVAISQPRNFGPRFTQAIYDPSSLQAVIHELWSIVRASEQPDAPLNASEKACHYCKAKAICPAYKAQFQVIEAVGSEKHAIATLGSYDLERLHVAIQFANKIKDEVSGEMRRRVAAGEMPGWRLGNSGDDVTLKDALGFFSDIQAAMPDGVEFTATDFDKCREIRWGELVAVLQIKLKVSVKRAQEIIRDVSAPYVTRTPKQQKVVRDKNAPRLADQGTTGVMLENPPE